MFYPSPSEIIKRRISFKKIVNKNTEEIPSTDDGVTRPYFYVKDRIRETYGDNIRLTKIYGEPYLRQLYGYDNIIKSGGASNPNKPIKIVEGDKLNYEFLSNNGKTTHLVRFKEGIPQAEPVKFDYLSGKYLLVCCFRVPMVSHAPIATRCRAIKDAYDELSRRGYPFEMVVVANLRTDVVYDLKAAFDHFYSAFSCLAIPFSDFETRHYIHSSITTNINLLDLESAILVDPQGIVLQDVYTLSNFFDFGSDWAPFLPTTVDAINKQDELLTSNLDPMYKYFSIDDNTFDDRPQPSLSLYRDILLCDPLLTLRRFDDKISSTVLELSRKYVALYLFIDGDIIEDVKAVHDHCLAKNQQLEIVLVPMPYYDEPKSHDEQLREALRSLNIKSWFVFNCPSLVSRRLWRIFGPGSDRYKDKLVIIPPDCKSCELYGREIITNLGFNEYPFTRTAILKRRLEYVRSLPPIFSSLFHNCLLIKNGKKLKTNQLRGKNVLLYLSWNKCDRYYSLGKKHYADIKAMGWEVVHVVLDYTHRYWNKQRVVARMDCGNCPCLKLEEMPWPYMVLPNAAASASIKEKLFFPEDLENVYLFAVRKDGKIVSRDVQDRLDTHGVTESLFDDVLESDLANVLGAIHLLD